MYHEDKTREISGIRLMSKTDQIKRINKLHYQVRSESNENLWYDVRKEYGRNLNGRRDGCWSCTCLDWKSRRIQCKHAWTIILSKKLRKKIPEQKVAILPKLPSDKQCPECHSKRIVKDGRRHNKKGLSQKYLCRACGYRFVINIGFENHKKDAKLISACIDLYFKGMSLRKVADHVTQFYGTRTSNVSVLRWVRRFGEIVAPFADSLDPRMGGVYQVDEMVVRVRHENMKTGNYQWLWNFMDDSTRYWVSGIISQHREIEDARRVFSDAKSKTDKTYAIIHDGLSSYNRAFQKEYHTMKNPRIQNIRSVSVRHKGLNYFVERLNGTVRDREKVMRGMQNRETSQKIIESMRVHYNYIRVHSSTGKTPAQQAGIDLDLGENKIKGLIELASEA